MFSGLLEARPTRHPCKSSTSWQNCKDDFAHPFSLAVHSCRPFRRMGIGNPRFFPYCLIRAEISSEALRDTPACFANVGQLATAP